MCRSTFSAELLGSEEAFDVGQYCRGLFAVVQGLPMENRHVDAIMDSIAMCVVVDAKDVYDKGTSDTPCYGAQRSLGFTVAWIRAMLRKPNTALRWTSTENTFVDCGAKDMDLSHMRDAKWANYLVRVAVPVPMHTFLKPIGPQDECWVRPHAVELESGIPRDRMLPQPAGHVWWNQGGEREIVYGTGGPGRWPLMAENGGGLEQTYVYDRRGPGGHLRALTWDELWRLQGRSVKDLAPEDKMQQVLEGTRATGVQTATNLLAMAGKILCDQMGMEFTDTKAGMCTDGEGGDALAQLLLWLKRWRRGELPRNVPSYVNAKAGGRDYVRVRKVWRWPEAWWWAQVEMESSDEEAVAYVRKGGGKKKRKEPEEIAEIVSQQVVQQLGQPVAPFTGDVRERVDEWLEENLAGDKSQATEKAYASAWNKWIAWAKRQGWQDEFLHRAGDAVENENKVLAYVGYLGWLGASPNTIRQHLFAIKSAHKRTGRGDPTEGMHRIWILVNALDRRSTTRKPRRLGVTPEMLEWLGTKLVDNLENDRLNTTFADSAMVMAALEVAWFYMLRAKEFAESNGVDESMIVRGCDLRFTKNGKKPETDEQPTEVTLQFRKTKTDQLAFGDSKTLEATGKRHLCPVEALVRMKSIWPERFRDGSSESRKPLFRWSSGRVLRRVEIQHLL